jgi:Carboxypeptidase regulatory-like domain
MGATMHPNHLALLLIASAVFAPSMLLAQTGTLHAKVIDPRGKGVKSAWIVMHEAERGDHTGSHGAAVIANIPVGTYKVTMRLLGHPSQSLEVRIRENQTTVVKFILEKVRISEFPGSVSSDPWDRPDGHKRPPSDRESSSTVERNSRADWIPPCPAPTSRKSPSWLIENSRFRFQLPKHYRSEDLKLHFTKGGPYHWRYETEDRSRMLSYYYGPHADRLTREEIGTRLRYAECMQVIGGKRARIVSYYPAQTGRKLGRELVAGITWRNVTPGVHLTLWGEARDREGLEELLATFRTVAFREQTVEAGRANPP